MLGPAVAATHNPASSPLPSELAATRAFLDGTPAQLLFVQAGTIEAITPAGLAENGTASLVVERDGVPSVPVSVPLAPTWPGILTVDDSGMGQALAFNEDGQQNSSAHPAIRGNRIRLLATGAGPEGVTLNPSNYYVDFGGQPGVVMNVSPAEDRPGYYQVETQWFR